MSGAGTGTSRPTVAPASRARETALIAELLSGKTIDAAARAIGVSRRTAYRLRANPSFQATFSQAKSELLSGAIASLHGKANDFVSTLHRLAMDPATPASARVGASREGISALFRGLEIYELEQRILQLEKQFGEDKK